MLPDGYELKKIDADIYEKCLDSPITADFVTKLSFLSNGGLLLYVSDN